MVTLDKSKHNLYDIREGFEMQFLYFNENINEINYRQ